MGAPKNVAANVRNLISHSSTCLPGFIEKAALAALSQGRKLLDKEWTYLQKKRDIAVSGLKKIPKIRYIRPEGAFYVFMDIRENLKGTSYTSLTFSEMLLRDYKVAMVPGEAFGCPGFLRLSYVVNENDLIAGVEQLGVALGKI
jgi:aspartate aminotransferase